MMEKQTDPIEIGLLAACLADNYLKEIYEKLKDWETFEESEDNTYKAVCWDDFVIGWGKDRLAKYFINS